MVEQKKMIYDGTKPNKTNKTEPQQHKLNRTNAEPS